MALTQSQMIAAVADRAEMSKADAKRALNALDEIILEELGNAQKVPDRRARPADGAGQARHQEAHGAQPGHRRADHDRRQAGERRRARARALAKAKAALPSVQKARRRLAA